MPEIYFSLLSYFTSTIIKLDGVRVSLEYEMRCENASDRDVILTLSIDIMVSYYRASTTASNQLLFQTHRHLHSIYIAQEEQLSFLAVALLILSNKKCG